jgi:hypothetical protein
MGYLDLLGFALLRFTRTMVNAQPQSVLLFNLSAPLARKTHRLDAPYCFDMTRCTNPVRTGFEAQLKTYLSRHNLVVRRMEHC